MYPDRIVLGGIDDRSIDVLARLYALVQATAVIRTTTRTAEMIKYTSNALLATLISFSNEIAQLCAASAGVDAAEVLNGVHLMRHLPYAAASDGQLMPASTFLWAGCGFGGSCFPKDVKALAAHAQEHWKPDAALVGGDRNQSPGQPQRMVEPMLENTFRRPGGRERRGAGAGVQAGYR